MKGGGSRRWRSTAWWLGVASVVALGAAGSQAPVPPASWVMDAQAQTASETKPEAKPDATPEAKPDEAKAEPSKSDKPKLQSAKEADEALAKLMAQRKPVHQACLLLTWGGDSQGGRILLDTGNGMNVVRQILASGFAPDHVRDIFVSHQHVDHVGGLEPLLLWSAIQSLRQRGRPPTEPTRVYAEPRIIADIRVLLDAVASVAPRLLGDSLQLVPMVDGAVAPLRGDARLTTFLVDHQPVDGGAMGCVVELDGTRLAYSGDTRPVPRLIEAAQGADVLIHEAGGLGEHRAEIHRQGHSTAGDVGHAARAAGVGRLVLTHMPAEALVEPMRAEAAAAFGVPVELATDLAELEL